MTDPLEDETYSFDEMTKQGLLWYINRVAFHPHGLALAFVPGKDGKVAGWTVIGDGTELWTFPLEDDEEHFSRFQEFLERVRA